jgi:hypothetical protein
MDLCHTSQNLQKPRGFKDEECSNFKGRIVIGAWSAFSEKRGLLIQAHELINNRRNVWYHSCILYLSLLWAILSAVTFQKSWNQGRTGMINNIFKTRDWNYLQQIDPPMVRTPAWLQMTTPESLPKQGLR